MNDLVFHPMTAAQVATYKRTPAQVVVLVGPSGTGKLSLAKHITEEVLELEADGFNKYQYALHIATDKTNKAIGIEAARELERFLSLKVPAQQAFHRAVIIEDAHLLTPEAQNALLKTLEEPPAGTAILLTVNNEQALLPTIRSRTQSLEVRRPPEADLRAHFKELGHDDKNINSVYAMSGGLPGLMHALLDDKDHPLLAGAEQARQLLSQSLFERLATVDKLSKQRELAADTIEMLQQMAHISLQAAAGRTAERWQNVLRASYDATDDLQANGQLKLLLTDMVLRF